MKNRKMKPLWKWIISVLAGLLVLLAGMGWYLTIRWKPILDGQIKQAVLSATDSLYRVEYDDLSINLLTGSAKLQNFRLISDSLVYESLEKAQQAPDNRIDAAVALVRIRGFKIARAIFSQRIAVEEISVDAPEVILRNKYQFYNDTLSSSVPSDRNLLGSLKELKVERIGIRDIDFTFARQKDSVQDHYHFKNVSVSMRDILIDSTTFTDSSRLFYTSTMELAMGPYELDIPDSHYTVGFDSLHIRTDQRQLMIGGLRYAPNISRQEFYQAMGFAKDMIQLKFDQLTFEGLDLTRFARSQRIHASRLYVTAGDVHVSNDRRYPRRSINKIGKSPHQQLMKLKHPIKIDTVYVEDTRIAYSEISQKYHQEGEITFERTSGWLANVTNDSISLSQDHIVRADLTTYVMNQGKLNALFTFDMLDERGAYTYKGTLGPMNGQAFNRILTPLLSAEVGSASIRGLRFDMQGHDYRNWGSLWFDYEDMKVNLLATDDDGNTSKKKLVSFLANELLLNSSNPDNNGKYIVGRINYQRPHDFSFFKTLWKSLLEGIKQTAGISAEREARLLSTAESAKTIREKSESVLNSLFRKRDTVDPDKNKD